MAKRTASSSTDTTSHSTTTRTPSFIYNPQLRLGTRGSTVEVTEKSEKKQEKSDSKAREVLCGQVQVCCISS